MLVQLHQMTSTVTYSQWMKIQKTCEVIGFISGPHLFQKNGQSSFPARGRRAFKKYQEYSIAGNTDITYSPQNCTPTIISVFLMLYTDYEVNRFESFYELRDSTGVVWALDTPMDDVNGLCLTITARASGRRSMPLRL